MLNKAMIIGNLGRDPEVRTTPSGQPVANFSVATTRKWKDRDGNLQENFYHGAKHRSFPPNNTEVFWNNYRSPDRKYRISPISSSEGLWEC